MRGPPPLLPVLPSRGGVQHPGAMQLASSPDDCRGLQQLMLGLPEESQLQALPSCTPSGMCALLRCLPVTTLHTQFNPAGPLLPAFSRLLARQG